MKRSTKLWAVVFSATAVLVVYQISRGSIPANRVITQRSIPTLAPGIDPLAGLETIAKRNRSSDYRRSEFGDSWTDDSDAPGGHNGCDTRNDILARDLTQMSFVTTSRCPMAVASGKLHDPYTGAFIDFSRGETSSEKIQIDHIVPLALAWDLGAKSWPLAIRVRFANDPANLIAVDGQANQAKGDKAPAQWMPSSEAFHCQYALQFIEVLRGYHLPVDEPSAAVLRAAAQKCPSA
ncbi:MAG: HNH endonuclease family protein [Mycobacteriaceae bacterium]